MSEPITGPWQVDEATYFADCDHISNSMLRVAARSLPEFHQRFVTRTLAAPKPSAEMRLGTLLHAAVLEPDEWDVRITTEKTDGRTKAGKEYNARLAAHAAANPSILLVTEDEEAIVEAMHAAIMAKPEAADALSLPGTYEGPVRWFHQDTGVCITCKCKFDKVCDNGLILDLKTTSDIANFPYSAHKYKYERQAAHYLEGAWESLHIDGPFLLIVVATAPPHEVRTMVFGEEELESGRRKNSRTLAEIAECRRTGKWESRYKGVEIIRYKPWQIEEKD